MPARTDRATRAEMMIFIAVIFPKIENSLLSSRRGTLRGGADGVLMERF